MLAALAQVFIAFPGCLNPRPEELPSSSTGSEPTSGSPTPEAPVRETCDDNALLAGCELPDQDINSDPISAPNAGNPNIQGPGVSVPPGENTGDEGAPAPADAGTETSDAGVSP